MTTSFNFVTVTKDLRRRIAILDESINSDRHNKQERLTLQIARRGIEKILEDYVGWQESGQAPDLN